MGVLARASWAGRHGPACPPTPTVAHLGASLYPIFALDRVPGVPRAKLGTAYRTWPRQYGGVVSPTQ